MNGLKDVIFQKLDMFKADILKEVPNLKLETGTLSYTG
jgi:hypothetical protein